MIINRFEEYGVKIEQIVNCGGIAEKNPFVMQIYADVTGRPMKYPAPPNLRAGSSHGRGGGGPSPSGFPAAREAMSGIKPRVFQPNAAAHQVYRNCFGFTANCMTRSAFAPGRAVWTMS